MNGVVLQPYARLFYAIKRGFVGALSDRWDGIEITRRTTWDRKTPGAFRVPISPVRVTAVEGEAASSVVAARPV